MCKNACGSSTPPKNSFQVPSSDVSVSLERRKPCMYIYRPSTRIEFRTIRGHLLHRCPVDLHALMVIRSGTFLRYVRKRVGDTSIMKSYEHRIIKQDTGRRTARRKLGCI